MLDPATTFTLQITNSTVASAIVTLNGVQILGPSDFRPNTSTITRSVSLRATNQITVEIRGAPGERFTLQITGTDDVPPSLSITSPPDRSTVATPTVTLQGTVSDRTSGVASVVCGGVAATVTGTNFTCVVPLKAGPNLITVQATDRAANTATASITVTLATLTISDFIPKSAPVGTLVSVTGLGFVPAAGAVPQLSLNKQAGGTLSVVLTSFTNTALSFVIPAGAATGPITVTVNGQTTTSPAPLNVVPSTSFTLTAAPASAIVTPGQTVSYSVQLSSANGFSQLAQLSASGIPTGVTASFRPANITAGQTSVLTLTAPPAQPLGTSTLTISASSNVEGLPVSQNVSTQLIIQAPTTSFIGRTVVDNALQTPLAGVTITMLGKDGSGGTTGCTGSTISDAAGNFALRNLPSSCTGRQLIGYDGLTATAPPGKYAGVNLVYTLASGQVTASPVFVHLPRIDNKETFQVQQNAAQDQTFAYSSIPGLSVVVYRGTTFTMPDGSQPNPFPLVAVQVPVDRLPDAKPPVPTMLSVFIVAFQPANARASQPVAVYYPNTINTPPGVSMSMMTLDPTRGQMVPYGTGTVSPDGSQIVPDLDPAFPGKRYGIVNFDWHGPMPPPVTDLDTDPECDCKTGVCPITTTDQPVHLSSGVETYQNADLSFGAGRGTVALVRRYRSASSAEGPFGIGGNHNYGFLLDATSVHLRQSVNLVTPEWRRYRFSRRSDGAFVNTTDPAMLGAVMTASTDGGVRLRWKDGVVYLFRTYRNTLPMLDSITDPNGNQVSMVRDPGIPARIVGISDPVGRSLALTYDGANRITSVTDPIGRVVSYTYNAAGALATVTDAEGDVTRYEYQGSNRLIRKIDARNVVVVENTYDAAGRVIEQRYPDGGIYRMAYVLLNPTAPRSPVLTAVLTDPLGRRTTYRFNPEGYVTGITDAMEQTRVFRRKAGTNLIESVMGPGSCAACGSAAAGDVFFTHDETGNILSLTDALGRTSRFTYDPVFSRTTSITDALSNVTRFAYDSAGNLISHTDANNRTTSYRYDPFGLLIESSDPLGNKTKLAYDRSGDVVTITDPLNNQTRLLYDGVSRMVGSMDPLGRRTSIAYDRLDHVVRQTDGKGGITQFGYDAVGNLLSLTDARGKRTSFTYDSNNQLLTRTTPLSKTDFRRYDLAGNLVGFTDRRGQVSSFSYDSLDRLINESYQDSTVNRFYDQPGRLVRVEDTMGGSFLFTYDLVGGLLTSAGPSGAVSYTRDSLDRVLTRQVAGAPMVTYAYDPVGNLASATMPRASLSFTYDERSLPKAISRMNGVNTTYAFDPAARLLSIGHSRGSSSIASLGYSNDFASQRVSQSTTLGQSLITQSAVGTYNDGNQILSRALATYTHDENSNLASETGPSGPTTYTWDSRNRLTSVARPDGRLTRFRYDFAGNMMQLDDNGPGGNNVRTFQVDDLTNVVQIDRNPVLTGRTIDSHFAIDSGVVEYVLTDAINSTVAVSDQNGNAGVRVSYDPYGESAFTPPMASLPFQFTGRLPISADLVYYRARFMNPRVGRFISEDPIGFGAGDPNLYRYGDNDPISTMDPLGLFPSDLEDCKDICELVFDIVDIVASGGLASQTVKFSKKAIRKAVRKALRKKASLLGDLALEIISNWSVEKLCDYYCCNPDAAARHTQIVAGITAVGLGGLSAPFVAPFLVPQSVVNNAANTSSRWLRRYWGIP